MDLGHAGTRMGGRAVFGQHVDEARQGLVARVKTPSVRASAVANANFILLIPEFCPGGQRLTCGPTLSTNQMRPWD